MEDPPAPQEQQENNDGNPEPLPALRSLNTQIQSFVRFVNRTQCRVDVIWLNYRGQGVKYKTLAPGEHYMINTYVTHPWVFRDAEKTAKLVVNSKKVFYPRPWFEGAAQEGQGIQGPVVPRHIPAYICIPLYSLKERATQVVYSCLRDRQDAFKLDIPAVLKHTVAEWGQ